MKETPKIGNLVKVIKISKHWDTNLLEKVGIVRAIYPVCGKRTVIGVEFVSWSNGHKLLFQVLDKTTGWLFYPESLEKAI